MMSMQVFNHSCYLIKLLNMFYIILVLYMSAFVCIYICF